MTLLRSFLLGAFGIFFGAAQTQGAASPTRGQLLYTTHCIARHDTHVRWRDDRRATGWKRLVEQVRRWQAAASLGWSEADIVELTRYLDARFYRYPRPTGRPGLSASRG